MVSTGPPEAGSCHTNSRIRLNPQTQNSLRLPSAYNYARDSTIGVAVLNLSQADEKVKWVKIHYRRQDAKK
jgi:hypothetical protein